METNLQFATDDQYKELLELAEKNQTETFVQLINTYRFDPDWFHKPDGILVQVLQNGNEVCLKELLKRGADVNEYHAVNKFECKTSKRPLFVANVLRNPKCVKLLLENNVELNALNKVGRNALHVSIIDKAPIETIGLLLEYGIDVNHQDRHGRTALIYSSNSIEYVKFLLEQNADVNLTNQLGQSPLMLSIRLPNTKHTHCDIPRLLLKNNANVNAVDKFQRSPLHYASSYKNADVANLLLQNGANIDSVDESNQTPLMFSTFYTDDNQSDNCQCILLSNGCDINVVDIRGNSALHHAARCGRPVLLEDLCQRGASINMKSEKGLTPLMNSIQEQKINCVKILLRFGSELESLQKNVNAIHSSIINNGRRHNTSAKVEAMYKLLLVAGLKITSQLPCDLECQETNKFTTVPSLMHSSRIAIRRTVVKLNQHTNLFCSVDELPLPERIKGFLLYNIDLTNIDKSESVPSVRSVIQLP